MNLSNFFDKYGIIAQVVSGLILAVILGLIGVYRKHLLMLLKARRKILEIHLDERYKYGWYSNKNFSDFHYPNQSIFSMISLKSRWWITNATDMPIRLISILFETSDNSGTKPELVTSFAFISDDDEYISPHEFKGIVHVEVDIFKSSEILSASLTQRISLIFVDNLGNRYRVHELTYTQNTDLRP